MDISIFEVLGPVMIGPSSSLTAGAARLARISAVIAGKPFSKVTFGLHGHLPILIKAMVQICPFGRCPWNPGG